MDWERYYATHPLTIGKTDYLTQVGHTVNGKPISEEHFRWIVSQIRELLDIQPSDVLLDLCCGNGLITKELAADAKHVVGIDFSEPLLEVATQDHRPANVSYQMANVLDLARTRPRNSQKFDKVLMYGALQHFKKTDLSVVLENILQVGRQEGDCSRLCTGQTQEVVILRFAKEKARPLHTQSTRIRPPRNLVGRRVHPNGVLRKTSTPTAEHLT